MSRGPLTAHELRECQAKLRELETRLTGKVSELEAEALRPTNPDGQPEDAPAHEADPAVRAAEEAVARTLLGSEEHVLTETRDALNRLVRGTFGRCERCGHAIARARLDAVPYARHCTRCAHEVEAAPAAST